MFMKKEKLKEVVTEPRAGQERNKADRPKAGCFLYGSTEHRMRDCPKRSKLSALVAEQADEGEPESARVNLLQVVAMRVKSRACGKSCNKGLMMVKVLINGKEQMSLVDTGATHTLISDRVVQKLRLDVKQCDSVVVKAVNTKEVSGRGITTIGLTVGPWRGIRDFVFVVLDDFDVILGNDFFVAS
ncbi:hypothetical protein Salat_0634500 [Sesamum alatum]|uniref:Uncharacterized protein n=1 Tax=Sesamum alatum TaxID=300844 RepID=A0AAE2CU85_9LAMI|nr:hypothetical protein Salat_0634500 [Sesamum alatum]